VSALPSIGRASHVDRPAVPGAKAASELYERFSVQIFGYCFHQLGSREEAEDAVQTTFMNAFRGLARGIVPEAEQAWIFKIAHNVCLSRRRSSWRRRRVEAPNNMEVLQEVVPAKDRGADELIRLQDVLETMPESQRRAILLREWQGLSYREIATELDLSQAAVETLIFRARRALASGLEDTSDGSDWRKRLRRSADIGGVFAFVKTLLGGGGTAAVKVGAVVALAGATVVTTAADRMLPQPSTPRAESAVAVSSPPQTAATRAASSPATRPGVVAVSLQRDAAPRVSRPPATPKPARPAASPAAPTAAAPAPTAASGPGPAPTPVAQVETAAPSPATAHPAKSHGAHGRPDPGPAPAAAEGNPGKGHGNGRPKDPPTSTYAPPAPAAPAEPAPGTSPGDGHDVAPGQNKSDPGSQGNGHGK
jgi:RNA polymerase sigma factor (sigma-70 family)